MSQIDCCKYAQRPTEAKEILSDIVGCRQIYLYLACCIKCGRRTVKVLTIDSSNKVINERRIKPRNIDLFFKKITVIRDLPTISLQRIRQKPLIIVSEYSRRIAKGKK